MLKPVNLKAIKVRLQVIQSIRRFFDQKGYSEVIVPVLHRGLPLEPTLYSFTTQWKTSHDQALFLATSPEASLKKMMAAGIGNCYALGKSFRNLEQSGQIHQPEFLMLEWYQENATYQDVMTQTRELLSFVAPSLFETSSWQRLSLVDLFDQYTEFDMLSLLTDEAMHTAVAAQGYAVENNTWEQLFNQIFLNEIEPHLPLTPFFLTDFPSRISPLCQTQIEKPGLAERFEVYVQGIELGNGNTELLDADVIQQRFDQEQGDRVTRQESTHPIDKDFISALRTLSNTGKSYAGIGLGVDRLSMLLAGVDSLSEVEPLAVT